MSRQALGSNGWDTVAPKVFSDTARFFEAWNPFLIGMAQYNGHAAEGIGTLFSEWQNFVSHRLAQDMLLVRTLATCTSPEQIAGAYSEFWWNAYSEYVKEFTTLNKLVAGISNKVLSNAHSASKEAAKTTSPRIAA